MFFFGFMARDAALGLHFKGVFWSEDGVSEAVSSASGALVSGFRA